MTVARSSAPRWHVSLLLWIAQAYALSEYARLVLLLLRDPHGAQLCYRQRISATEQRSMLEDSEVLREMSHAMDTDDELESSILFDSSLESAVAVSTPEMKTAVQRDDISTNMLLTPSCQSCDDSEMEAAKPAGCGHENQPGGEGSPVPFSLCACEEDDLLVTVEDDIRKPDAAGTCPSSARLAHHSTHVEETVAHTDGDREDADHGDETSDASMHEPFSANDGAKLAHAHLEEEQRYREQLLSAADESSMDIL